MIRLVLNVTRASFLRVGVEAIAISAASYGLSLVVRYWVRPDASANWITPLENLTSVMASLNTFNFPNWIAVLLATATLLTINVSFKSLLARKFVFLAAVLVAPAVLFGLIAELRVLLPTFLMLAFAVAASNNSSMANE